MNSNTNVLVTGAAGFIGSHLVRKLLARGDSHIVGLDDLSGGFVENLPHEVEFIEGSVTDVVLITKLFNQYKFKYVYHLAAYAAEGLSHFIRRFNYNNNMIGSVNLINESVRHEVDCFVFTSSIAVYGASQVPMREDMIPQPEDPYGIAKYAVELDLKAAREIFGLNYVIFRPHNVFGEFQNIADKYRNVVGIFMNQILQGQPMTVFGDGKQVRAFSYVRDIVTPMVDAARNPIAHNRVFNIGADTPCTVSKLVQEVAQAMGVPGHAVKHLDPRNEVMIAYSDHSAIKEVFGSIKQTSLEEGLAKMAAWVKDSGARKSSEFHNIEVYKNMPPFWR